MKKLMLAAIAATTVGAALAIDCELPEPKLCVYAYRIKLAGKTVKAKALIDAAKGCELGGTNCWAKAASYRVAGYLFDAGKAATGDAEEDCKCDCVLDGDLAAPDYTEGTGNFVFWDETKTEYPITAVAVDKEVLRNSGAKDKAQLFITMSVGDSGSLYLAGFGVYNPKTYRLKRAHGFFTGKLDPAECPTCDDPIPAKVFAFCDVEEGNVKDSAGIESAFAIAYGRWNLAWKHEKVALLEKGANPFTPGNLIPHNFTKLESDSNP